jgi:hypothetical protein
MPGVYTYLYRVSDAAGNSASEFVRVSVEQRARVSITLAVDGGATRAAAAATAQQLLQPGSDANIALRGGVVLMLNAAATSAGRPVQQDDVTVTAADVVDDAEEATFQISTAIEVLSAVAHSGQMDQEARRRHLTQQTGDSTAAVEARSLEFMQLLSDGAIDDSLSMYVAAAAADATAAPVVLGLLATAVQAPLTPPVDVHATSMVMTLAVAAEMQAVGDTMQQRMRELTSAYPDSAGVEAWLGSTLSVWSDQLAQGSAEVTALAASLRKAGSLQQSTTSNADLLQVCSAFQVQTRDATYGSVNSCPASTDPSAGVRADGE